MASYLLDTNAVVALLNEEDNMVNLIQNVENLYISATIAGELYFGAEKSARKEENIARIESFVQTYPVIKCDLETARLYGEIQKQLRDIGCPIPQNDMWIAATALQHDLILVTKDKHFDHIDNLQTQAW